MNRALLLFFCAVLALLFSLSQTGCPGCQLTAPSASVEGGTAYAQ